MRSPQFLLRMALVPALALVGVGLGRTAEASWLVNGLLLLEPLIWVVSVWLCYVVAVRGNGQLALGIACGVGAAAACARLPRPEEAYAANPPAFVEKLRSCSRNLKLPDSPVRVVQWSLSGAEDPDALAPGLLELEPDVVVLFGQPSEEVLSRLAAELGGESRSFAALGAAVVSRGVFHPCGEVDAWEDDTPGAGHVSAMVFAGPYEATLFPLVLAALPSPTSPDWADRGREARGTLHATLDRMQSSLAVAAISGLYPLPARRLDFALVSAQLRPAFRGPNTPAIFPLHGHDQLWAADAWEPEAVSSPRLPGASHRGVAVTLRPRWATTLPLETSAP